jgi:O-methyltransferase involved in polyketide biosynthesis
MTSREDDDTWDIATSVGATAVLVAAARAAETVSPHSMIRDQFAGPLISTPKLADVLATMSSAGMNTPEEQAARQHFVAFHAVQTHFFDAYCVVLITLGIAAAIVLCAALISAVLH